MSYLAWDELYLEGRNKLRWALQSTLQGRFREERFLDLMYLAGTVMQDVLDELKRKEETPDYEPWWRNRGAGAQRARDRRVEATGPSATVDYTAFPSIPSSVSSNGHRLTE